MTPCSLPRRLPEAIELVAKLDDAVASNDGVDAATGQVVVIPITPLSRGLHILTARAVDRFGHDAELEAAITVLERDATEPSAIDGSPLSDTKTPIAAPKAANKVTIGCADVTCDGSHVLGGREHHAHGNSDRCRRFDRESRVLPERVDAPGHDHHCPLSVRLAERPGRQLCVVGQGVRQQEWDRDFGAGDGRGGRQHATDRRDVASTGQVRSSAKAQRSTLSPRQPMSMEAWFSVEFFDGTALIGAATTSPFSITWIAAGAGNPFAHGARDRRQGRRGDFGAGRRHGRSAADSSC